ncbi:MAG TPA: UDP-N-acetylmuramoyl-tripeptide--D-alanyl-D-alanine ligase [Gemmatimonadales bacterium]|nr:UDP-N-acetylmuramoyl-tripeptide--D-alanyl-D-alanine ligase [Gemmatimonadales bacterium]
MSAWTPAQVLDALAGAAVSAGVGLPAAYSEIATDTRTLAPGALFVALRGERFDGHDHLGAAQAAGALGAVVRPETPELPGLVLYRVPDTLQAYGDLARARRERISGPVIAVGGANGKTSTKEMCAAVLRTRYRVHATPANDNNLVGIPKTILSAPEETESLVIEAGASLRGELARARAIIRPTATVTTNVVVSHLEGFGSVEGVLEEELDLLDGVPLAIVGTEPPLLAERARARAARVVTAGLARADRTPQSAAVDSTGRATLVVDGQRITLPLLGLHQAANAMLAWTLGHELGVEPAQAAEALRSLRIPGGRGEVIDAGGLTIVNDAYNANPSSFLAAIGTARAMRGSRRLVFVAGGMRELGPESARHHAAVAAALVGLAPDLLAAVGEFAPVLQLYAGKLGDRLITAPDAQTMGPLLKARLRGDELVILKASRGVQLERILPYLTGQEHPTH